MNTLTFKAFRICPRCDKKYIFNRNRCNNCGLILIKGFTKSDGKYYYLISMLDDAYTYTVFIYENKTFIYKDKKITYESVWNYDYDEDNYTVKFLVKKQLSAKITIKNIEKYLLLT